MNDFIKNSQIDAVSEQIEKEIMESYSPNTGSYDKYPTADKIVFSVEAKDFTVEDLMEGESVDGIIVQDEMQTYLSDSGHFQSSTCKSVLKSPLHFRYAKDYEHKELMEKFKKDTSHFDLGNYLHECVLEPEKFDKILTEPKHSMASHDGLDALIKWWENQIRDVQGISIPEPMFIAYDTSEKKTTNKKVYLQNLKSLSQYRAMSEEHRIICEIAKSNFDRYENGLLHRLVKHSISEVSFYTIEPEFGHKVKVRTDAVNIAENIGVDAIISVKTTRQESVEAFKRDAVKLGYHTSEGMYQKVVSQATGRPFLTTLMIMIQTVAPYGVALLHWSPRSLEIGKYRYGCALSSMKQCLDADHYPSFEAFGENGIIDFDLPAYAEKPLPPMIIE